VYAPDAVREDRIGAYFGPWMHRQGSIGRLDIGPVTLLGLDPNGPQFLSAHGEIPADQLDALASVLADPALSTQTIILTLHYPVVDRRGALYDGWSHGLLNASSLVALLEAAPSRPAMVLHGHVHHGYTSEIVLSDGAVTTYNPGSSGYAWMPAHRRAAGMNVYTITTSGHSVERYLYDGEGFSQEPGGAYATGR
jgi:3',5'-cyclic AMP phosphodiesterase CpdA